MVELSKDHRRVVELVKDPRRVASAIARRLIPGSTFGLGWRRVGEYITFRTEGFAIAPSIPLLLARHNYETSCIRDVLRDKWFHRSLEVGCGYGRLSPTFASFSANHIAVDINADALRDARQCYPQVRFTEASATSLPFPDDSFDLVTTWTVLQHIRPSLIEGVLAELRRISVPGATFLLCETTRFPESKSGQTKSGPTWDRPTAFYVRGLDAEVALPTFFIERLDQIGMASPGEVMLMRTRPAAQVRGDDAFQSTVRLGPGT